MTDEPEDAKPTAEQEAEVAVKNVWCGPREGARQPINKSFDEEDADYPFVFCVKARDSTSLRALQRRIDQWAEEDRRKKMEEKSNA